MSALKPIPLQEAIIKSYQTSFWNFWYYVQIAWLSYLLILGTNLIVQLTQSTVIGIIAFTIDTFVLSSVAVGWHRKLLSNETNLSPFYLRLDKTVWNYFLFNLLLLSPFIFFLILAPINQTREAGYALISLIIILAACVIVLRLSVGLPGKALGWPGMPFEDIWQKTKGNMIPIVMGSLACIVPIIIGTSIVTFLSFGLLALPASLAGAAFLHATYLAFITHVFEYLYEPQQQGGNIE